ncbi:MAG: hypothetical protein PHD05_01535 [Sphaerochaetaceae bacterium]|nr:hypothetical protein [Sphaerochaetaceae bacterium]
MTQFFYPTQERYNDPTYQRNKDYSTEFSQKYLSRASNEILNGFLNNIILKGLDITPTYLLSIITATVAAGLLVHDFTFIELTETSTLDCDVSVLDDTDTGGAHLAIFTDFKYIESPDLDAQTEFKLSIYHIAADGTPTAFSGSPEFDSTRNLILAGIIDFTKSGSNVIACSLNTTINPLTINSTDYYVQGLSQDNIFMYDLIEPYLALNIDIKEFLFHDNHV